MSQETETLTQVTNEAISYTLDDGREFNAGNRAEAIVMCPFLSKLPLEQANIFLELAAMPVPLAAEEVAKDEAKHAKPKERRMPKQTPKLEIITEPESAAYDVAPEKEPKSSYQEVEINEAASMIEHTHHHLDEIIAESEPDKRPTPFALEQTITRQTDLEQAYHRIADEFSKTKLAVSDLDVDGVESAAILPEIQTLNITEAEVSDTRDHLESIEHKKQTTQEEHQKDFLKALPHSEKIQEPKAVLMENYIEKIDLSIPQVLETETSEIPETRNSENAYELEISPVIEFTETVENENLEEIKEDIDVELTTFAQELALLFDNDMPNVDDITTLKSESIDKIFKIEETMRASNEQRPLEVIFDNISQNINILHEPKPLEPELVEIIQSLQELVLVPESVIEFTPQIVEQVIQLLEFAGIENPKQVIKFYAETHSKEEFIKLLTLALLDLSRLIDNQSYLLASLQKQIQFSTKSIDARLGRAIMSLLQPLAA